MNFAPVDLFDPEHEAWRLHVLCEIALWRHEQRSNRRGQVIDLRDHRTVNA